MKTLVIIRDCHSKNNIVLTANSDREEEKIRLRAMSKGFLVTLRKPRQQEPVVPASAPSQREWRKPAAIFERPRLPLGGAFDLVLTPYRREGGGR